MYKIAIDFEFNRSSEKKMNVIACVLCYPRGDIEQYNLTNSNQLHDFHDVMLSLSLEKDTALVSFAAIAEARALLSLGIDPLKFKWIDLYVEFRMLCNSNNKFKYGKFIDGSGGIKHSYPPKINSYEEEVDLESHEETPKNLINAIYKMLGIYLSSRRKEEMRDLILSEDETEIKRRMPEILEYCASDTKYLLALDVAIRQALEAEGLQDFQKDQLERGEYAVCTAICEHIGMPIDMPLLRKIIVKTPEILNMHKEEVNKHFPFFVPETTREPKILKNGSAHHYKPVPEHKDMGAYQKYVPTLNIPDFPKTETGRYKLDKDTLEKYGYWGGLEELWKYNKTESSLKWFNKENKNGFFDRLGSDDRVRPYFGIFGTQTGRNAAKAKTFPLAMSSWLRAIIRPPEGQCILAADFSQQEVYVAAVLSQDDAMMSAYKSGDVYLNFAKQAGLVPSDATKESHKKMRTLCKSTVLGIQFGMGKVKLRIKLSLDSGEQISDELTDKLYTAHKEVFHKYWQWVYKITEQYKQGIPLVTSDGWTLFCDNPSIPSVRNFLVQATGAAITRKAICMLVSGGSEVICGLHDAIYILNSSFHAESEAICAVMENATRQILVEEKTYIRIDTKIITNDQVWVEEKGEKEWNKLKQFLI